MGVLFRVLSIVESDTVMTQLSSLSWACGTANKLPCIEDNSRETIGLQRSGCSAVLSHRYEYFKEQIGNPKDKQQETNGGKNPQYSIK